MQHHRWDQVNEAAVAIQSRWAGAPSVGIVLGTGLGALAAEIAVEAAIPYGELPHFPTSTVESHAGQLVCGTLAGRTVMAMEGRFHLYEGYTPAQVTFPIRVMRHLGCRTLLVSNAAGGLNPLHAKGDLIVIDDHINLMGVNPLIGPNDDRLGPRFPDMTDVYDRTLRNLAMTEAEQMNLTLHEGIYAALPGPSYETPAEIRMLRTLGADVVGMSTVPEAIVARHAGMKVLAFALVTNPAAGITGQKITHEEVLEEGRQAGERLGGLIEAIVPKISSG